MYCIKTNNSLFRVRHSSVGAVGYLPRILNSVTPRERKATRVLNSSDFVLVFYPNYGEFLVATI